MTFADHYQKLQASQLEELPTPLSNEYNLVSYSANEITVYEFIRFLSHQFGVSIVAESGIGERLVTMEITDQPLPEILESLSRHLGVSFHKANESLYYLGQKKSEDGGMIVRRVRNLSPADLQKAIGTVAKEANVTTYEGGLMVASGDPVTLKKIETLIGGIETQLTPTWTIQLYLLTMTASDVNELGLDASPALDLSLSYGMASVGNPSGLAELNVGLQSLLKAAQDRSTMSVTAQPLFYLIDGESATFERVSQIPIIQRAVSAEGTITTTGYSNFQAGTSVNVELREVAEDAIKLTFDVELSDLKAVSTEGFPSSDRRTYNGASIMKSGGVYLLSSIDLKEQRKSRQTYLNSGKSLNETAEVLQIWGRAVRVTSPL